MTIFFRKYSWLCLFLLTVSCGKKEVHIPDTVLKKETMVAVLTDIHLAEATLTIKNNYGATNKSLSTSYYKFIFEKHKISSEQFKNSFDFYTAHPDLFSEVYKEVMNELSQQQAETQKK